MADEKQTKRSSGKPLDGSQKVSRQTDVYNKLTGEWNEPLAGLKISEGGPILSKNYGVDVSLDVMSEDTKPFTGKNSGFYAQNKAKGWYNKK